MKRPIVPVLIAIGLAFLAGLAVFLYARGAESRAIQAETAVTVLVTTSAVPAGTTLGGAVAQGLIEQTQVSDKLVPDSAIGSVTPDNSEMVAAQELAAGQVVLSGDFAAAVQAQQPLSIPEGLMAVSVVLGDPQKVGTFVRPGSYIAVFDTVTMVDAENVQATAQLTTRPLLDRVQVLAIGPVTEQAAAGAGADAWSNALLTVAVDQGQAEKLIHGIQTGQLYLALLGENTTLKPSVGVSNADLFK